MLHDERRPWCQLTTMSAKLCKVRSKRPVRSYHACVRTSTYIILFKIVYHSFKYILHDHVCFIDFVVSRGDVTPEGEWKTQKPTTSQRSLWLCGKMLWKKQKGRYIKILCMILFRNCWTYMEQRKIQQIWNIGKSNFPQQASKTALFQKWFDAGKDWSMLLDSV